MTELLSFGGLVVLTIGIVEVIKRVGLAKRFLPLSALVVGIVLTTLGSVANITSLSILTGIAVGLSAVGLFNQKKIIK